MLWILELVAKSVMDKLHCIQEQITSNHTQIMSAISDFAAKQKAFNDRQAVAIDGLVADVKALNDKIVELQNTPGPISPEDQALLNEIEAKSAELTSRMEALDNQTPPPVPTPPPTP